jgi:hypothetical protein
MFVESLLLVISFRFRGGRAQVSRRRLWQMGVKAAMMDCRQVTFPWHLQSLVYDGSPEHVTSSFIIMS